MSMVLNETMEMAEVFDGLAADGVTPVDMRRVGWLPCAVASTEHEHPFQCTRQSGHSGQHVASAFKQVAAVWPR